MEVDLAPHQTERLEALARERRTTVQNLLRELIDRALEQAPTNGGGPGDAPVGVRPRRSSALKTALRATQSEEIEARMPAEARTLRDRIRARRQAVGVIDFSVVNALREMRKDG